MYVKRCNQQKSPEEIGKKKSIRASDSSGRKRTQRVA